MLSQNKARLGYTHEDVPVDLADINHLNEIDQAICKLLADDPFITQRNLAKQIGLDCLALKDIAKKLRDDSKAQQYILRAGVGTKYWTNTIYPLLANGSLSAAIERRYMYPNRIGLYTGMSCMFYCNFCGRNPVAKYQKRWEKTGLDVFKQIIDQDPKTDVYWEDRFRISGGLEPLTNQYLGDIITYGSESGYKMQLYTNGFMMSDRYIDQHPGMLDLHAVRFSLYGTDAESAFRVTRHAQSFNNIIDNVITYINRSQSTKVGLNWIILPGHANEVLRLMNVVDSINQRAKRPLDFVTLREDFSQNIRVISNQERQQLIDIFQQVIEFKNNKWPSTHWDFGYTLEPLTQNRNVGSLEMVSWKEMVPESFPQVAVAVDVKGDVYVYHESGFLERPGSERYIIGNINDSSIGQVVESFVIGKRRIRPMPQDVGYLDAFDHVVTRLINQHRDDEAFGIPWNQGPVAIR